MNQNLSQLPADLPIPLDDGQAAHLVGMDLPNFSLPSTSGQNFNFDINSDPKRLVIYVYPLTGQPNVALPEGWDEIPGARGCTPQACDFSDNYQQFQRLHTQVFGLSTQTSDYQLELKKRLHLPFNLLSDSDYKLKQFLNLPTFKVGELTLYKRLTLIIEQGIIKQVFYPVFPPNQHALQVLVWLKSH